MITSHHEIVSTNSGLAIRHRCRWDGLYDIPFPYARVSKNLEAALRDDAPKSAFIPERKNPDRKPVMNAQMRNKVAARRGKNRAAKKAKRTNR